MTKPVRDDATRSTRSRITAGDSRFQIIFDAVNDGIFISDPATGRFIEVNEPGCQMFGYTRAELIGRDIVTLSTGVHPYTQEVESSNSNGSQPKVRRPLNGAPRPKTEACFGLRFRFASPNSAKSPPS